jgi:RHS repeat-associated protein
MKYSTPGGEELSRFLYTYDANHNVNTFTQRYLGQQFPALDDGGTMGSLLTLPGDGPADPGRRHARWSWKAPFFLALALALGALGQATWRRRVAWRPLRRLLPTVAFAFAFVSCGEGTADRSDGSPDLPNLGTDASADRSADSPNLPDRGTDASNPTAQVTTYSYDAVNRLLSALVSTDVGAPSLPQFSYRYDANSNPTSITAGGATQTFEYGPGNALTTGSYDKTGNLTALRDAQYSWDAANRLNSVKKGEHESLFTYDGFGRVVRQVERDHGATVEDHAYLWCGTTRCLERDNTKPGAPISKRYFDQGVVANGEGFYYVVDRLGSVRQLTDSTGAVRAQYEYEPFGRRTKIAGDIDSDIGFAGYVHHAASGLAMTLFRFYDPVQGRWLNRDPIAEVGGLNLYAYARNNPVGFIDLFGLDYAATWGAGGAALGGTAGFAVAIGGSLAVDAATGGVNILATPAEVAGGTAIGAAAGGVIGYVAGSIADWVTNMSSGTFTDAPSNQPPFTGAPGSTSRGGTGSRTYGPDGYPQTDRDLPHPDEAGIGSEDHCHDWGRPPDGSEPTHEDRGPPRAPAPGDPPPPRGPNVPPP